MKRHPLFTQLFKEKYTLTVNFYNNIDMIYNAESRLQNHSKKFNSVHTFYILKWLGRQCLLGWGRCSTSCLILSTLIIRPFDSAQSRVWKKLVRKGNVSILGISKLVSSAYLSLLLKRERGWRSLSIMIQMENPMSDPWTILDVMGSELESAPPVILQTWDRPVRKLTIQLRMWNGMLSLLILDNRTEWRTTSKAFEKSTSRLRTKHESDVMDKSNQGANGFTCRAKGKLVNNR